MLENTLCYFAATASQCSTDSNRGSFPCLPGHRSSRQHHLRKSPYRLNLCSQGPVTLPWMRSIGWGTRAHSRTCTQFHGTLRTCTDCWPSSSLQFGLKRFLPPHHGGAGAPDMAGRGGSEETVGEGRPYLLHCSVPASIELQLEAQPCVCSLSSHSPHRWMVDLEGRKQPPMLTSMMVSLTKPSSQSWEKDK